MDGVVVLPEIEFEALLEAWERFLDALLPEDGTGARGQKGAPLNRVGRHVIDVPPGTLIGGLDGQAT